MTIACLVASSLLTAAMRLTICSAASFNFSIDISTPSRFLLVVIHAGQFSFCFQLLKTINEISIPSYRAVFNEKNPATLYKMMNDAFMKQVGQRISQLRRARGLKQEDMCRFGFDYKYYQRIEYGQKNLTLRTINRLADAFCVEAADILKPVD